MWRSRFEGGGPETFRLDVPDARHCAVRVWDPVVRIFHWGVVLGCTLNLFILEEGKWLHRWVGYTVMGLLAVRFVWGFAGSPFARFSSFFPTPGRLAEYTHDLLHDRDKRHLGHNPLAALMMFTLMALLAVTRASGYMQTLDAFWGVKWVKRLHEFSADFIMVFAGLHAAAALAESWRHRENLIWSMVTGRKRRID